jgi:hypothetical protein
MSMKKLKQNEKSLEKLNNPEQFDQVQAYRNLNFFHYTELKLFMYASVLLFYL